MFSFQGSYGRFFTADGDGEIRTLDPLLARQVLSQLSYTPTLYVKTLSGYYNLLIRQPPILPCRLQQSTFGRLRLDRRVRYGNGYFP